MFFCDYGAMARCCNCEGWVVDELNIKFNLHSQLGQAVP